jgi:hypothetical protein
VRKCGFGIESFGRNWKDGAAVALSRDAEVNEASRLKNGLLPGIAGKEFFSQIHENEASLFNGEAAPGDLIGACWDGTGDQVVRTWK